MQQLPMLDARSLHFPHPSTALETPNGLLAFGGDLSTERLITAYHQGIFPWFSDEEPILWWSPNPRLIIDQDHLKISRSLKKSIKNKGFSVTINHQFQQVIESCQSPHITSNKSQSGRDSTWITGLMKNAYLQLHHLGHAHSFEVWHHDQLVGGLYGIGIGTAFFGESMFSERTDASKVAFVYLIHYLTQAGFGLIDCQVENPHLARLGAFLIPREQFLAKVAKQTQNHCMQDIWFPKKLSYKILALDT